MTAQHIYSNGFLSIHVIMTRINAVFAARKVVIAVSYVCKFYLVTAGSELDQVENEMG